MRNIIKILFVLTAVAQGADAAEKLVLVENGQARVPIVVFADAPPLTRLAADDLAAYIEKISGARPPVIEGLPNPLPEHAIWVGYQPVLNTLFPKLDFDFQHAEEILIANDGQNLVIAGRDRWDPKNLTVAKEAFDSGRKDVEGFQYEYGTANAVSTFLQNYLGVRWLWPGEEEVPEQPTITLTPFELRYHPTLRMRQPIFWAISPCRIGFTPGQPVPDWNRFNRVSLDSLYVPGNHAFSKWWDQYHEAHPDYFALQPDGTRSGYPSPNYAKICESNPKVWEQWLDDVEAAVAQHPTLRIFNAAENDGWNQGHCICSNCLAWDDPEGTPRPFSWQGLGQEYVALSDRQVTFANHLARGLKARFPGKDYSVAILAYGNSEPPPIHAVPDDNVFLVDVQGFFHDWEMPGRLYDSNAKEQRENYIAWSKVAKNHIWRPNIGQGGWKQGMPTDLDWIAQCFRLLGETGCKGVYLDSVNYYWGTQAPAYYLLAQLAWNPMADAEAMMNDYFQKGFGPAGESVHAYFRLLQIPHRKMLPGGQDWVTAFDKETFTQAEQLLEQAQKTLEGAPERYTRRLAFVRAGYEFLRLQTENRALVPVLREAGDKADAGDLARARTNWSAMQELAKRHPSFWHPGYSGSNLRPVVDPDYEK